MSFAVKLAVAFVRSLHLCVFVVRHWCWMKWTLSRLLLLHSYHTSCFRGPPELPWVLGTHSVKSYSARVWVCVNIFCPHCLLSRSHSWCNSVHGCSSPNISTCGQLGAPPTLLLCQPNLMWLDLLQPYDWFAMALFSIWLAMCGVCQNMDGMSSICLFSLSPIHSRNMEVMWYIFFCELMRSVILPDRLSHINNTMMLI